MKKILICEDEPAIRDFVVINLQRSGYTTVAVSSGEEALRVFGPDGGDFDVALLDIMMPGIDGFTVCKELRQRSNCVGIVMLTAKSQEEDKVRGLTLGADDYVVKPFSPFRAGCTRRGNLSTRPVCEVLTARGFRADCFGGFCAESAQPFFNAGWKDH